MSEVKDVMFRAAVRSRKECILEAIQRISEDIERIRRNEDLFDFRLKNVEGELELIRGFVSKLDQ